MPDKNDPDPATSAAVRASGGGRRRAWRDFSWRPRRAIVLSFSALAVTYAAGYAAGFAGRALGLPLPYVLGPLFVTIGLSTLGLPVYAVRRVRPAAQFVIGSAIGVQFTYAIMEKLILLLPLIFATAAATIVICTLGAVLLMALVGLDRKTAFFATSPAGAAEMANIAARYGGEPEPILVSQTMRVVLIVTFAPFLVTHFADHGALLSTARGEVLSVPSLAMLAVAGLAGGYAVSRTGFPNCWFMGPLAFAAVLGTAGLIEGRVPDAAVTLAQVVIGCSLGAQLRPEFITKLGPTMLAATAVVLFILLSMATIAVACAYAFAIPMPTMVLALAPAGMAEMALTGKVLGLDAQLISGFHLVRIVIVMLTCVPLYRIFERIGR